jgi:hypothetical protein
MPAVAPSELYRGSPRLLRTSGLRHSLGWQLHRTAGPGSDPAPPVPATIPDQLGKLASLLADGVLTREEFEHLKAKVIAQA